jgi:choline kinase
MVQKKNSVFSLWSMVNYHVWQFFLSHSEIIYCLSVCTTAIKTSFGIEELQVVHNKLSATCLQMMSAIKRSANAMTFVGEHEQLVRFAKFNL